MKLKETLDLIDKEISDLEDVIRMIQCSFFISEENYRMAHSFGIRINKNLYEDKEALNEMLRGYQRIQIRTQIEINELILDKLSYRIDYFAGNTNDEYILKKKKDKNISNNSLKEIIKSAKQLKENESISYDPEFLRKINDKEYCSMIATMIAHYQDGKTFEIAD